MDRQGNSIAALGHWTTGTVAEFGGFCRFCGSVLWGVGEGVTHWRRLRELLSQMYSIGSRSVPVVMVTGAFVGMVLAVQTVMQFKSLNMTAKMGTVINLSVLRELGPVLAGVMLAGRVGGALTAELGTMRVTEQIDALRALGADPVRVLVVPRLLASVLLMPVLVLYACCMGILGGYLVSVELYGVNDVEFWRDARQAVGYFDILYGPIKALFFGSAVALICCYKGFRCSPGAAGVGRATTESFVASCMAILALDFFLGLVLNTIYVNIWGFRSLLL